MSTRPFTRPQARGLSRRAVLGGAATAGLLAPFVPLLPSEAADDAPPTRFISFFQSSGTVLGAWQPTGGEHDFTLPEILAPLAPYRDKIVVIDGLVGQPGGHGPGCAQLTGSPLAEDLVPHHVSVDQYIAAAVGQTNAFRSLEFGVNSVPGFEVFVNWVSYSAPGVQVPAESDPAVMFQRLFADASGDAAALAKRRAQRKSVLDLVHGDLKALRQEFGSEDRAKLEAHLDALREFEEVNDAAIPMCGVPAEGGGLDAFANDSFPEVMRRQMDLIAMALACDLTRVVTLQSSRGVSSETFTWLGQSTPHHEISHQYVGQGGEQIIPVSVWFAEQLVYLMDALAAIPEGDGTVLDHTAILWWNELSDGLIHSNAPLPYVLAGGANGMIETGRYLKYDQVQNNRLLVSLCHIMGIDEQQSFGLGDTGTGGLGGLT